MSASADLLIRAEQWIKTPQWHETTLVRDLVNALTRCRRACECGAPDPVMQADMKFYCHRCSFETGARPPSLFPEELMAELAAARQSITALRAYVQHRQECASLLYCAVCRNRKAKCEALCSGSHSAFVPRECTCGLTALSDPSSLTKEQGMSHWQPIETAPVDEKKPFLVFWQRSLMGEPGIDIVGGRREYDEIVGMGEPPATHWMPFPDPPKATP